MLSYLFFAILAQGICYVATEVATENEDLSDDRENETESTVVNEVKDNKIWSSENTMFLIDVIKKYDKEFSKGIKKNVWEKVARDCRYFNKYITGKQCETKWKTLKRTYKTILLAKKTSGEKKRYWEYFDAVHEIMFKKPEISPVATCSSSGGLKVNGMYTVCIYNVLPSFLFFFVLDKIIKYKSCTE